MPKQSAVTVTIDTAEALRFIESYVAEHGYGPSVCRQPWLIAEAQRRFVMTTDAEPVDIGAT